MIYEHRCNKCELVFTDKRPLAEIDRPVPCPDCGGDTKRLISPVGFTWGAQHYMNKYSDSVG